jgi:hypothetical protein
MYANALVENNPTVTLFASGGAVAQSSASISGVQPIKQGYATGLPSGTYTAIVEHLYRVEIQDGGTGSFGTALWRWTDEASGTYDDIVWQASNLTPLNGVAVALNNGIFWTFTQVGAFTPQFETGDYWLFQVSLRYGQAKGRDGSRDMEYRSGTMPTGSTIEHRYAFPSSVAPTAFVLMDHNIPSNATISLKPKAGAFTDPPATTIPVTWQSGKIVALLTPSAFTHWRICVTLAGTAPAQGYLRWSELFLGASLVFDVTFEQGFQDTSDWLGALNVDTLRRGPGPRQLEGRQLSLTYGHMTAADQARLALLRRWINDPAYEVMRSFYLLLMDSDLTNFSLFHWTNGYVKEHQFLERYSDPLELTEVVRTRAS